MAKSAKATPDIEITERMEAKFVKDVLEQHELIESARGSYMNKARRHRETIVTVLEGLAARGVPQSVSKLHIKVIQTQEKLKGLLAELDSEERKMAMKLAKCRGKEQLALFADLPPAEKPEVVEAAATKEPKAAAKAKGGKGKTKAKATAAEAEAETEGEGFPGVTGSQLTDAFEAAGNA